MSNGQLVEQKPPVWRAVVTLAVAAFLLYSCMSPSDDEKRRDERIDAEDSTTVIVEAPMAIGLTASSMKEAAVPVVPQRTDARTSARIPNRDPDA